MTWQKLNNDRKTDRVCSSAFRRCRVNTGFHGSMGCRVNTELQTSCFFATSSFVIIIFILSLIASAEVPLPQPSSAERTYKARPLPLSSVRLLGGPLKNAQDLDGRYLLSLENDRMLAYLRRSAGLKPKAKGYGGWDGDGRQLTGHIAGHYLSAVSLMWAATGDVRFRERADSMVRELKEIQEKQGDGYLGALQDKEGVAGKIRFQELAKGKIISGGFDLNGLWSPWYVQHKIYAGLRDAFRYTGNRTALEVEIRFARWAEGILSALDEVQIQKMLATEFGGMNEIAADLYADTGEKRWLALADKFHHQAVVDPLAAGRDILPGVHGNTQVPKLLGSLMRHVYTGDEAGGKAARFFWETVAHHHSFATGGHGKNEYFGEPEKLNDMVDGRTAETCNVYNMLKMTRVLFALEPDIRYADFHERALFNHILASIDPKDGRTCYMVPVGRGVQHEYQNMMEDFTCCVGSGMESHALHGLGIYYESGDKLWINQFVPSIAKWEAAGVQVEMNTDFPEGESVSLKLTLRAPKKFALALRCPSWAGTGTRLGVNGQAIVHLPGAGSYIEILRTWRSGDRIELVLPKSVRKEALPDNPNRLALLWGPLVLAGDVGEEKKSSPETEDAVAQPSFTNALVTTDTSTDYWLKAISGRPGEFRTQNVGLKAEIDLVPFYRLHRRRYSVYWDLYTPQEWEKKARAYQEEQEKRKKLEAATVSYAQPGQMQNERDFNQQGEESQPVQLRGRHGRRAIRWFSFDMTVDPTHPMTVMVTFSNDERRARSFSILLDGVRIGEHKIDRRSPEKEIYFYEAEYAVPLELTRNKKKVTLRFEAKADSETAAVYGIRIVRTVLVP